jgi:hypothetical protein
MCTILLPPGVNPIAVKYIIVNIFAGARQYSASAPEEEQAFSQGTSNTKQDSCTLERGAPSIQIILLFTAVFPIRTQNVQLIIVFIIENVNTKYSNSVANLNFVVQVSFKHFNTGTWRIASGQKYGQLPAE